MKRIYLSGPMTGYPDSNFPAFHETATKLRNRGFEVVNPAELNPTQGPEPDNQEDWNQFYKALMDCEAIALMPGWEASNGANLELHVAHRVGMEVLFVDHLVQAC